MARLFRSHTNQSGSNKPLPPNGRSFVRGGQDCRHKNAEPRLQAPRGVLLADGYAAAFFAAFGCALAGGFAVTFFAVLAFSFAANSCLTLAVIAAMSTL